MLERHIGDYHFVADRKTGRTLRWGKTLKENPTFAPVPELADISISNHCSKGCSFCYRNSKPNNEFMSLKTIIGFWIRLIIQNTAMSFRLLWEVESLWNIRIFEK